jgi:hypothetical protein
LGIVEQHGLHTSNVTVVFLFPFFSAQTSTVPNSTAVVSLWRRFFELKDQKDEEKLQEILSALEEEGCYMSAPIQSETVVAARNEFLREPYRPLMGTRSQPTPISLTRESPSQLPNLLVPSAEGGSDYVYRAQ